MHRFLSRSLYCLGHRLGDRSFSRFVGFWIVVLFFSWTVPLPASGQAAGSCSSRFLFKEKKVRSLYFQVRKQEKKCSFTAQFYLDLSKRAYLAQEYSIAIWAAKKGLSVSGQKKGITNRELTYYLGISFLEKDRLEEAIRSLQKIVQENPRQKELREVTQKSHLALIEAYYRKKGKNKDDILYLVHLFYNRYGTNGYRGNLRFWTEKKGIN